MVEKIKKGSIKHCVTALLCIFFSSIIYTQESENSFDLTSKYDETEQIYEADTNQEDDALAQTPLQPHRDRQGPRYQPPRPHLQTPKIPRNGPRSRRLPHCVKARRDERYPG